MKITKNRVLISTLLTLLLSVTSTYAQEISLSSLGSITAREQFSNSYGYQIGYSQLIYNKHKLGFKVNHLFSQFFGKYPNYFSSNDGKTYYREEASSNQRIFVAVDYLFRLFSEKKSSLFIGPEVNLNYYSYKKDIYQYPLNQPADIQRFDYDTYDNNKLGFGATLAYYYKLKDNFSLVAAVKPEIARFSSRGGCVIFINSSPWLQANIGLVYHFTNRN